MKSKFTFFAIVFFCLWPLFFFGSKVANDYHYIYQADAKMLLNLPYAWRSTITAEGLGEYAVTTLWSWPLNILYGVFSNFGLEYSLLTKIIGVVTPVFIGGVSILSLLKFYGIKNNASFAGATFFLLNSYILLLIDGGQLSLVLAYMLLPAVFLFYQKFLILGKFDFLVFFTLVTSLVSFADFRILIVINIFLFLDLIFNILLSKKIQYSKLKRFFLLGFFCGISLAGFHGYWLFPSFLSKSPDLPLTYGRASQVEFLSFANIGHTLLSLSPHWYRNIFGDITPIRAGFILIPILVFLAPIFSKGKKVIGFWLVVSLVSVFLSKGSNLPFGFIYTWLFLHFPGFSLFRDPTKFYFLIGISYSILIAYFVDGFNSFLEKFNFSEKTQYIMPLLIIISLLLLDWPVWMGKMTGILGQANYIQENIKIADLISNEPDYSRILWIPIKSPLGYSSSRHPSLEAVRLSQKRPFAQGTVGTYETLNYLREASFSGQLLDVLGVKYISYLPPDPNRTNVKKDNLKYYDTFLNQLRNLFWIKNQKFKDVPLLETKNHQDHIFLVSNLWWIIGSDDIYSESTKSADLRLSNNALVFADEYPGFNQMLGSYPAAKIVLNKKKDQDLAAGFIKKENFIFPSKNLDFNPDKTGWWKREGIDLIWWKDFLKSKYGLLNEDFDMGGGWAVAEGDLKLDILDRGFKKDKILLARVLESTRSGELKFMQGNEQIGFLNTNNEGNNFLWKEVGKVKADGKITIFTKGDINVINSLAVLDENTWLNYQQIAKDIRIHQALKEFATANVQNLDGKVSFKQINPAKYEISISGLRKPELLVFSESYDPLWVLNGKKSIPVYSILNGFEVDKDGVYTLEYLPQRFVYKGLLVSGLTFLLFILFLLLIYKKHIIKK